MAVRALVRVGAHSHIKGLGLDENGKAKFIGDGLVGQIKAREAAGLVVKLIKEGKMAGRAVLLAGPPGTGKTAIAIGIARELGSDVPFVQLSGSEIYSAEISKTEVLMKAMRKAIGVRFREKRWVLEGEIAEFEPHFVPHPFNPYQRVVQKAKLTLRTKDERATYTVGPDVAEEMISRSVRKGMVVMIDKESGRVSVLGISEDAVKELGYDIGRIPKVPVPSGPVEKEREFVWTTTLDELDELFHKQRSSGGLFSLLFGGAEERKEIDPELRAQVDRWVKEQVEKGKAEIIPGVLFIDEIHMLDIESFSFLNRALESELAPIVIMASNRGLTKIRGTDIVSPHGMPLDLLDRLLIIPTYPYNAEETREILRIRAREEGIKLEDDALELLVKYGTEISLRYAVQLMAPAAERAKINGRNKVTKEDIEAVRERFASIEESIKHLKEWEEKFMK
ncbi:MAG: TATA box-binding protein [Thermoprotei archaeon]|nr:MAG: TATA box-binding protein [Thermoprotei archaeon]